MQLPTLLNYRIHEYKHFLENYQVAIAYTPQENSIGHFAKESNYIENVDYYRTRDLTFFGGRITYQSGILRTILKFRPSILFIQSNVRYISFWLALILCKLLNIKVVGHGQGLYRFKNPSILKTFVYALHISFSDVYACYTELSKISLNRKPIDQRKLAVARNTITNTSPVTPELKVGDENGILFIGRIRERAGIETLLSAVQKAREISGIDFHLHIVGGGSAVAEDNLSKYSKFVTLHGPIFDDQKISTISKYCFVGVYPGDAGLSVVHYMSLSLPPIVHDDIFSHMGPEPSYIAHKQNGLLFSKKNAQKEIAELLIEIHKDKTALQSLQISAFETYKSLCNPGLGRSLLAIFNSLNYKQST